MKEAYKIELTRTEFCRLMRGYSNQSNKTVDRKVWKCLKATAINSNTIGYKVLYDANIKVAYIDVHTRTQNSNARFSSNTHPSLVEFINYIFHENYMGRPVDVSNSTSCPVKDYGLKTDHMDILTHNSISASEVSNINSWTTDAGNLSVSPVNGNWGTFTITTETDCLRADINDLRKEINKLTKKEKENKTMFNFDFGKVTSDAVRISMYGIAVKNVDGRYVSYDKTTHSVMDVEILNMPAGDFLYKMPVAIKDVKAGDVVIHNRVPMFVVETHESTMKVIDIREGTEKEIYLTKSPFGFNFATKVISLMDMAGAKADESNPFGNMLPFMLMGDNKDFDPMMLMVMSGGKFDMSNPMMMYLMMKDADHKDLLPMMLAMNMKG